MVNEILLLAWTHLSVLLQQCYYLYPFSRFVAQRFILWKNSIVCFLSVTHLLANVFHFLSPFPHPCVAEDWRKRWVESDAHKNDNLYGRFGWDAGTYFNDWDIQVGMKTLDPKKFYHISADIGKNLNNRGKVFILSYTMKHEAEHNCTGAYIKLFPDTLNQSMLSESEPYEIMFGPDSAGPGARRLHFIMRFENQTYISKQMFRAPDDKFTHMYTLIIRPNNNYEILIDGHKNYTGSLREEFDCLGPKFVCQFSLLSHFFQLLNSFSRLLIQMPQNQKTGMITQKSQIHRPLQNQMIGMTDPPLLTSLLRSQTTGMSCKRSWRCRKGSIKSKGDISTRHTQTQ